MLYSARYLNTSDINQGLTALSQRTVLSNCDLNWLSGSFLIHFIIFWSSNSASGLEEAEVIANDDENFDSVTQNAQVVAQTPKDPRVNYRISVLLWSAVRYIRIE